jgi:hypothetical protein
MIQPLLLGKPQYRDHTGKVLNQVVTGMMKKGKLAEQQKNPYKKVIVVKPTNVDDFGFPINPKEKVAPVVSTLPKNIYEQEEIFFKSGYKTNP